MTLLGTGNMLISKKAMYLSLIQSIGVFSIIILSSLDGFRATESSTEDCQSQKNNVHPFESWDSILETKIISNGNVWPPSDSLSLNSKDNCLLLLSHSYLLKHCPFDDEKTDEVLHQEIKARFRGAFTVPSSPPNRLWILSSPAGTGVDLLQELDLKSKKLLQIMKIPGTIDAHDAVRYGNSVFIADTRHGNVVELELPKPSPADTQESLPRDIRQRMLEARTATVIQRHQGFTRSDHINNLALQADLILTSLHGGGQQRAKTRLSLLPRDLNSMKNNSEDTCVSPEANSKSIGKNKLYYDQQGDLVIDNAGNMCHGIAFFNDEKNSQIKLITLDSINGALVSVVLSPPPTGKSARQREVLWTPNLKDPVLNSLETGYNQMAVFSKGLSLQGNVAYFVVSGARKGQDRMKKFSSLIVAYDLVNKKELYVKTLENKGLVNQVISLEYLNSGCEDTHFEWPN